MSSPLRVLVLDAGAAGATAELETSADAPLAELRSLVLSLGAALPAAAAVDGGARLVLCHDGRVLSDDDDETSLAELGVAEAPAIVALASWTHLVDGADAAAAAVADATDAADAAAAAAPPPRAPRPSTPPADAACRICFGAAFENGAGRLISPCLCAGSMSYVHVTCLNDWRVQSTNPRSFFECDQCKFRYKLERTKWAALFESVWLVRAVAAALVTACVCAGAAAVAAAQLCGIETPLYYFYRLVQFHPQFVAYLWPSESGVWLGQALAATWGPLCERALGGALVVAAGGLGVSVHEAYRMNRHVSNQWLVGIVTALASGGVRVVRVFAVFGFLHSLRVATRYAEAYAKELTTKWGSMVLDA